MWRAAHGVHFEGYEGPVDSVSEIDELKRKMRSKQKQLPRGYPNLLYIENHHVCSHYPVSVFHLDLQEEVFQHSNLAFVLIRGSSGSGREEVSEVRSYGEHRFERRVNEGHVRHTLLLSNRFTEFTPSHHLAKLVTQSFFSSGAI